MFDGQHSPVEIKDLGEATLKVADAQGAVAATTFSVNVKEGAGKGGADVRTTLNTWPTVAGIVPSPTRIDVGESTALALTAAAFAVVAIRTRASAPPPSVKGDVDGDHQLPRPR